jgi:Flp pilus assembly protein TadG
MVIFLRYAKSDRGQAIVEFTLVALLFFALLFAIVEFSHLFYVRLTLQHALKEAGRFMVTGQGGDADARKKAIEGIFLNRLIGTGSGLQGPITFTCAGGCSQPVGGPGQTVTATATFIKPWFTGFFGTTPITFSVSTTWKNEPFG